MGCRSKLEPGSDDSILIDLALDGVSAFVHLCMDSWHCIDTCSVAKHINEEQRLTDALGEELLTYIPGFFVGCKIGLTSLHNAPSDIAHNVAGTDSLRARSKVVYSKAVTEKDGGGVVHQPYVCAAVFIFSLLINLMTDM